MLDTAPAVETLSGTVLHVGCGSDPIHPAFAGCVETRLDIDPKHKPDIVASMVDMGAIGPFDSLYTCHALEHLYPDEVGIALREFRRVLKPGGAAVIVVPDLEDVRPTEETVYVSPAGPVCGLDMYYGMARLVAANRHMAHHCGFTAATLKAAILEAGFREANVTRSGGYNLIGAGIA